MAFNKQKLYKQALEIAKKGGITSIEDIIAFLPCSKPTFYSYIKVDSQEMDDIKEALAEGKRKTVISIRGKLFKSNNPTALLALYRMLCTQEERDIINTQRHDITSAGEKITAEPLIIEVIDKREQLEEKTEQE